MIIESWRLILRPWEYGDAAELYEYAKDPDIGGSAGWLPHKSVEESLEIIRTVLSEPETYAIVPKETGRPIGSIGIFPTRAKGAEEGELEIGYWIGKPYWGRGFAPEAVTVLLKRCFDALECKRVWCGYFDGNDKSRRCQEKCGFVYDHTEKDVHWEITNEIKTEHYSSITADSRLDRVETERLVISPATLEELIGLIKEYEISDPELSEAYREMLCGCENHPGDYLWYVPWKFCLKDTGEMTGDACFKGKTKNSPPEIGYGIIEKFRNCGFATEGVRALCEWAFKDGNVSAVAAETAPDYEASKNVLRKIGFVPSGETGKEGPRFILRKNAYRQVEK